MQSSHDSDEDSRSYSSSSENQKDLSQFKTGIVQFQKKHQSIRDHIQKMNHALTNPYEYQRDTFHFLLQKEKKEVKIKQQRYQHLKRSNNHSVSKIKNHTQKKYQNHKIGKFTQIKLSTFQKIIQHHSDLINELDNRQEYHHLVKKGGLLNYQLFKSYIQTQSWEYYLRGCLGLVGAVILHLNIGAALRWNMINNYITSYYKIVDNPYLITKDQGFASCLAFLFIGIGMRLGIRISKIIGTFYTFIISIASASFFMFVGSFMPNINLFIIVCMTLYAFCIGLSFNIAINQCHQYFPKKILIINGLMLSSNGLGHIIWGFQNTLCMNPGLVPPRDGFFGGHLDYISRKSLPCIRTSSFIILGVGIIGICFLYPMIKYIEQKKQKEEFKSFESCSNQQEALTSGIFWFIGAIVLFSMSGQFFLAGNYAKLPDKDKFSGFFLMVVLMTFKVANAISTVIFSIIFPKVGFKVCFLILSSINVFIFFTIPYTFDSPAFYLIEFILGGIVKGGLVITFINMVMLVFGTHIGSKMPGYIYGFVALANFLNFLIVDFTDTSNNFTTVIFLIAILDVISIILVINKKLQGDWDNSLDLLELECKWHH